MNLQNEVRIEFEARGGIDLLQENWAPLISTAVSSQIDARHP